MKYPLKIIAALYLFAGEAHSQGAVSAWNIQDKGLAEVMKQILPTREPVVQSVGKSITFLGLYDAKKFRELHRELDKKGIIPKIGGMSMTDAPLNKDFDFRLPHPSSLIGEDIVTFNLQSVPNVNLTDVCVKFRELEFKMRGGSKEMLLFVIGEKNDLGTLIVFKLDAH